MSKIVHPEVGILVSLWRYPVKSMLGEELSLARMSTYGMQGDRAYAVLDHLDGKVATAKNPRKWPLLFHCKAKFLDIGGRHDNSSPVSLLLPDGTQVTSEQADLNKTLSQVLNREVILVAIEQGQVKGVQANLSPSWIARSEEYWPDIEGREWRDTVTDFSLPTGTFFDAARVHLLTTATLATLSQSYPAGSFEVQRFRPNIVVESSEAKTGFMENNWIGHMLAIGDDVRLNITAPCGRCVMTTLPQGDLLKDPGILRTVLEQNEGNVGVYATVEQGGTIRCGDRVRLES